MTVFKVLQGGEHKSDSALMLCGIVPLLIGILSGYLLFSLLATPPMFAAAWYAKRLYGGKPEWAQLLYRELHEPEGSYSNAEQDI